MYLYELLDAHQALFQGIKGGGVEHLLLDLGRVGAPGHQEQFLLLTRLRGALALVGVLKIKHPIPEKITITVLSNTPYLKKLQSQYYQTPHT